MMSLRVGRCLKQCRFLWTWKTVGFSLINKVQVVQKCLNLNYDSTIFKRFQHNSNQTDLLQDKSKHHGEDLSTKMNQTGKGQVLKRTVTPILQLDPLKRSTKTAKIFETIAMNTLNEEGFKKAIEIFQKRDVNRVKLIDFVSTAMGYMEPFGVSKNVEAYNYLLDIFPKGVYHNKNVFDTLWTRHRPQIDCAIRVLTKLEENRIQPNVDTYDIIHAVFGEDSIPMSKVKRIVFWFHKFDEMYPDPLPKNLPTNKLDLFELAVKRMIGDHACLTVYKDSDEKDCLIVGAHNQDLLHQLEDHNADKPLFVEGPHYVWLRKIKIYYHILQADITPHLGNEDSILALCIIDDGGEKEVNMWINELQKAFPQLANLNVIFNISNSEKE